MVYLNFKSEKIIIFATSAGHIHCKNKQHRFLTHLHLTANALFRHYKFDFCNNILLSKLQNGTPLVERNNIILVDGN
jgi:hypothetical protein